MPAYAAQVGRGIFGAIDAEDNTHRRLLELDVEAGATPRRQRRLGQVGVADVVVAGDVAGAKEAGVLARTPRLPAR
eukprot:7378246-Prymnesium_polylepis.1